MANIGKKALSYTKINSEDDKLGIFTYVSFFCFSQKKRLNLRVNNRI